jgi:hypothetical protein
LYYVKVVTRGATAVTAKGSPRQALAYITDGHDSRRDPGYSDAELVYVARMGEGWKTDLEDGRVPLVGFGVLRDGRDEAKMAAAFEDACLPRHDRRATTGYKSMTFTVPKEVSLFACASFESKPLAKPSRSRPPRCREPRPSSAPTWGCRRPRSNGSSHVVGLTT